MFWKFIRWGGTVIVTLLLLAAVILAPDPETAARPAQPADPEAQPSKNFNL